MSIEMPKTMLVDMNSFFASVEQQANLFLRGKPIGVCASLHETSCLIAASKEAKALGIKTGSLVYKAKKIYPKIILLQAEPEKYREVNRKIVKIFYDYTNAVEVYSIDEAFLDLSYSNAPSRAKRGDLNQDKIASSALRPPRNGLEIGAEIKKRIRREVGEWLTCSIGIAPNKFMAKLAADLEKPDGLSIVWREQLPLIYKTKKFRDLWGVALGWERRLARLGILSPLELLDYPVQNLISVFGKPGYYIWERINGLEQDVIPDFDRGSELDSRFRGNDSMPKSFGHSWVLNFRTMDKGRLKPVILRLAEKAARRMRADGFKAYGVCLSLTLVDGTHQSQSKKLKYSVDTGLALYREVLKFLAAWKLPLAVLHIAVRFTNLTVRRKQLGLFGAQDYDLTQALDRINDKYGEFIIRSGLLAQTDSFTPDAIAFGK